MQKNLIALTLAAALLAGSAVAAAAQSMTVTPVSVQMQPGQQATSLTLINQSADESAVQVRAYVWSQVDGKEVLTPSDDIVASPPLATIAPGAIQVVRLVLRQPVQGRESSYRILLDQIPPAAAPGTVRIALRLSIPVFAPPAVRSAPRMAFYVEKAGGQAYLVAVNSGTAHDSLRDITLTTAGGATVAVVDHASPYVLAATKQHWRIASDSLPAAGGTLQLTAHGSTREIAEAVPVVAGRP